MLSVRVSTGGHVAWKPEQALHISVDLLPGAQGIQ